MKAAMVAMTLVLLGACGSGSDDDGAARWPDVEVVVSDDEVVETGSWIGEPLVVNFWFSTCVPCARELGEFAAVNDDVGDEVRFIGVNPIDDPETMREFAAERGVRYELVQDRLAELQMALDIPAFPATFFVSSSGEIVDRTGVLDEDGLRSRIDELIATEATSD